MGLFDYIKRKEPEEVQPPTQTPHKPQPSINTEEELRAVEQKPQNPPQTPAQTETKVPENPKIGNDLSVGARIANGEDVFRAILDEGYKKTEKSLKQQRAADFWGNLAALAGQVGASAAGARQFAPIKANTQKYNDALANLYQGYNSAVANYAMKKKMQEDAAAASAADRQFKAEQTKQEREWKEGQTKADREFKAEQTKLDREHRAKLAEAKTNAEIKAANLKHKREMEKLEKKIAADREKEEIKAGAKGKGAKISELDSIVVTDKNGNKVTESFTKDKIGSLISLYDRMRQINLERKAADPNYKETIEEISMNLSPSDVGERVATTLKRNLQNYPELTDEFYRIIGKTPSNEGWSLSGSEKTEEKDGWSLK